MSDISDASEQYRKRLSEGSETSEELAAKFDASGYVRDDLSAEAAKARDASTEANGSAGGVGDTSKKAKKKMTIFSGMGNARRRTRARETVASALSGFRRFTTISNVTEGSGGAKLGGAITSIAVLGDGHFLAASRHERRIKMYRISGVDVELVKEFSGHSSGVTALVVMDRKGRFLSAGLVRSV